MEVARDLEKDGFSTAMRKKAQRERDYEGMGENEVQTGSADHSLLFGSGLCFSNKLLKLEASLDDLVSSCLKITF